MRTTAHDLIRRRRRRIGGILLCNARKGTIVVNILSCIRSVDSADRDRRIPETEKWRRKRERTELVKAYECRMSLGELTHTIVSLPSVKL